MKSARLFAAALALIAFTGYASQSQTSLRSMGISKIKIPVQTGWQFRELGKDTWYSAIVPSCVHTDLLNNKLIDDPFYRDNEQKLQWIGKTDWEYQTTFNVTPEILERDNIDLVFEGLDTYANVFLNNESLLNADNMFRTWRTDCKRLLRPGANTLRIRFRSPINEVLPLMAELPATRRQRSGRKNKSAHAQGALSVWLGLGAALCHERYLASRLFRGLGQGAPGRFAHLAKAGNGCRRKIDG